ncbi:MAG: hypothetical protein ACP5QT_07360 [Brevinematia bacterium]
MFKIFDFNYMAGEFRAFSLSHLMAVLVITISTAIIIILLKKVKTEKPKIIFCRTVSAVLIIQEIMRTGWYIAIGKFLWGEHLPFRLCGLVVVLSVIFYSPFWISDVFKKIKAAYDSYNISN